MCVQSREKEVSISFLSLCAVQHIAFSFEMKIKKRPGLHICLSLAKKKDGDIDDDDEHITG